MRQAAYELTIAAAVLAGTVTGVALGLAAAAVLKPWLLRDRPLPIEWEMD